MSRTPYCTKLSICSAIAFVALLHTSPVLAASVAYQYDALGRIKTATYDNGVVITYYYDAAGNRTSQVVTGASTPPSGITWGNFTWGGTNKW